ncbi:hypothetical protein [Actinoplanes aureus]|jgi:hypothetical protein|nr:hypothetical protein [Actinoplanes aureus]
MMMTVHPAKTSPQTDRLNAARAEALFVSSLSAWADPTEADVEAAIREALLAYGGFHACAAEMAAAYGDHPETAAGRMRWARRVVGNLYPARDSS